MVVLQKEYLAFTGGVEQGNGKMPVTEMISLLGTLTSVRSSEPRTFAAKQNVLAKKLLNLCWGGKEERKKKNF